MASPLEVDKLKHSGDDPISGNAAHAFELPYADGTTGQALVTDGSKTLSFDTVGGVNTGWNLIQTANITSSIEWVGISKWHCSICILQCGTTGVIPTPPPISKLKSNTFLRLISE